VSWFRDKQFFEMAVLLYGVSTVYFVFLWRKGFREDNRINYGLLLGGFIFHTIAMFKRGFDLSHCPVSNLYEAISFLLWTTVTCYLVFGIWWRLRFLGAFVSPVLFGVGIFALMPDLDLHGPTPQFAVRFATLHAALILLAYGTFGLGAVAGLMYVIQERNLKLHKLSAVFSRMPSIQRLESAAGGLLLAGFILLTLGLLVSPLLMKQAYGVYFQRDPKILWSGLVWMLYLWILVSRWALARTGRLFAWGAIGSFSFILLTFWGFNLLSSIHRGQ
jgi:ABC-type uncharacterized transport system permease subunit